MITLFPIGPISEQQFKLRLLGVLIAVIIGLAIDQARAEPQTRFYDSQVGASARPRLTAPAASGTTMRGAEPWARPRRPATPPGSTTLVVGRLAARPPLARWRSREDSASRPHPRCTISRSPDGLKSKARLALPWRGNRKLGQQEPEHRAEKRHPFLAAWQRRTKAWQTMTNPARGAKRPRSVKSDYHPWSANVSDETDN
jgi:hypothetical protein